MSLFINPHYTVENFAFYPVRGFKDREIYVEEIFKKYIEPIFGDQSTELKKMWNGQERKTRVLCERERPVALFVFKNSIVEQPHLGRSLEIKQLIFTDKSSDENDKKKHLECMINYINHLAKKEFKEIPCLSMAVTQNSSDLCSLLTGYGFKIVKTMFDFHESGDTVHFLRLQNKESKESDFPEQSRKRKLEDSTMEESATLREKKIARVSGSSRSIPTSFDLDKNSLRNAKNTVQVTLKKIYIHQIRDGKKTIEGRIYNGQFKKIANGKHVRFYYMADANDDVICKVVDQKVYSSFSEMLQNEGFEKCVPACRTFQEAVSAYHAIPGYEQKAKNYGAIAFKLELIAK